LGNLFLLSCRTLVIDGHLPLPSCSACRDKQQPRGCPCERQCLTLLAHLLREQVLLRCAVDGGGKIRPKLGESCFAFVDPMAIGGKIDPSRLAHESPRKHWR